MVNSFAVDGLSFSYGDKRVLERISFELRSGEIFGILGPNGCGKSTLIKNLNNYYSPDEGAVYIDGDILSDFKKKEIAQRISVVPQSNEVRFAFTVKDIVSMGRMPFLGQFKGMTSDDEEIVERAMVRAGVKQFENRLISTMSGGERQKVIIARALAQTPKIILMDEPTLHLDISAQFEILDFMHDLSRKENMTVVIVSHDLPLMARYCDRISMIHDRRILCIGTPEETLTPENMSTVFNIRAHLSFDEVEQKRTVIIHGANKHMDDPKL